MRSVLFLLLALGGGPVLAAPPIVVDVLANDLRADPASLTLRFPPAFGTAVIRPDRQIEYTPDPGLTNAVDSVPYRVCKLGDATDCKNLELTIHVGGLQTTYVDADTYEVPSWSGGAQPAYTFDVLANDRLVDPSTLAIVILPIHGAVTLAGGQLVYRPGFGHIGADSLLMKVTDGGGISRGFSVNIHVGQATELVAAGEAAWFPILDVDADGLSDHWETSYATGLGVFEPTGDADGDGQSDRDECVAGTHPMNAGSMFRISAMTFDPATCRFDLTYTTGIGRSYTHAVSGSEPPFVTTQSFSSGFQGTGAPLNAIVPCAGSVALFRVEASFR